MRRIAMPLIVSVLCLSSMAAVSRACDIVLGQSLVAHSAGTSLSLDHSAAAVVVLHVQVLAVPTFISTHAFVQPLIVKQQVVQQHCVGQQRLGILSRPRVRSFSINRTVVR